MLRILEDAKTIAACQKELASTVRGQADETREHRIGYPGGSSESTLYYVKSLDFWMGGGTWHNRHYNVCGIGYPFDVASPAPHVEINIPVSGIDRRIGGAFLEDEDGVLYIAHSGKVGGGAKGVSKSNFHAFYPAYSTVRCGGQDIPEDISTTTRSRLLDLGTTVVAYGWRSDRVVFDGLDAVVSKIKSPSRRSRSAQFGKRQD